MGLDPQHQHTVLEGRSLALSLPDPTCTLGLAPPAHSRRWLVGAARSQAGAAKT